MAIFRANARENAAEASFRGNARENAAEASAKSRETWQSLDAAENDDEYVGWSDASDGDSDGESGNGSGSVRLMVKPSTIPNAGDGLFLRSAVVPTGAVLLKEEAVALKRADAKRILADPVWAAANPVIQLNGGKFLDIRKLLLYKSNHAFAAEKRCNARVSLIGPSTVALVSLRTVRKGEELMWEYSPTWYPPGS